MVHGALPLYFVPAPAVVAAPAQRSDRQSVGRAVDCVADQRRRHTNRQSRPTHRRSHKSKLISKSRPTQILLSVVLRGVALTPRSLSLGLALASVNHCNLPTPSHNRISDDVIESNEYIYWSI